MGNIHNKCYIATINSGGSLIIGVQDGSYFY